MYCSIDKIDLTSHVEGTLVAVQTDTRRRREVEAEPELSMLFAMARVLNARAHLDDHGHHRGVVHYTVSEEPPQLLREALAAAGAFVAIGAPSASSLTIGRIEGGAGAPNQHRVGALADRSFAALAQRVKARVGSRDLAIALRMLEDQTCIDPPRRDDELGYWSRVLELAALAGELLRAKYSGHWVATDRAVVPFGFQVEASPALWFPTNRAQRVIEDGPGETLFKLLMAAADAVVFPTDGTTGRLMPSLRDRSELDLDQVVWRPILDGPGPSDLPVIVCGIDGENTFAMIRRAALAQTPEAAFARALSHLGEEPVDWDEVEIGDLPVVILSGSFYAAEKLLDRDLMLLLHRELGAELLAAAAPARGCLLVTPANRDEAALAKFCSLARARHRNGGGRAISPAVLLVERGQVAGYVRGPGDPDPHHAEPVHAEILPATRKRGLIRRLFGRK